MKAFVLSCFILLFKFPVFAQLFSESTLPIVEINTLGLSIPIEGKITASMEITFRGVGVITHLHDIPNIWNGKVEIGIHGASSAGYPQKSYGFTTMNAAIDSNIVILDMPREHDWVLINNWNEKSFVRNTLAHKIFSEMGHYGVRMRHCEVILNGKYVGVYLLSEKIKVDKGRVNISKLTEMDNSGAKVSGGYIIKNDVYDGSNGWASLYAPVGHSSSDHPYFIYVYPSESKITSQQRAYIKSFIDTVETALYSSSFNDLVNGYSKYIHVPSFIDYFLLNELARNVDGHKKSSYWYKNRWDKDGKLKAGPVWDFDWAWKNINDCTEFSRTDGSGWSYKIVDCHADVLSFGWLKRLLQDPNFTHQVRCRWEELRATVLNTEKMFSFIDSTALALALPQQRHFNTFPVLGLNNGAPQVDLIPTTYQGEIDKLKNWISTRTRWLDENLPGTCETITAISESDTANLTIYPNPGTRNFIISSKGKRVSYVLYNSLGLIIRKGDFEEGENSLEITEPSGLYFLQTAAQVLKVIVY